MKYLRQPGLQLRLPKDEIYSKSNAQCFLSAATRVIQNSYINVSFHALMCMHIIPTQLFTTTVTMKLQKKLNPAQEAMQRGIIYSITNIN
jgi:hypothetical protein